MLLLLLLLFSRGVGGWGGEEWDCCCCYVCWLVGCCFCWLCVCVRACVRACVCACVFFFFFFFFFGGGGGILYCPMRKNQVQQQEQRSPFLWVCAAFPCTNVAASVWDFQRAHRMMLNNAIAHGFCTDTVKKNIHRKLTLGEKKYLRAGDSNPRQYCT